MKRDWKIFLLCLGIPLGVGALSSLVSGGMGSFAVMQQPPLSPPGWVFPVVWTALYLLMGYASYRVLVSGAEKEKIDKALTLYGIQLVFNFLWSPVFFGFEWYFAAFVILVVLWVLIFLTIKAFAQIDKKAADLLIPYILWVTFAGYLNLGVYILNR